MAPLCWSSGGQSEHTPEHTRRGGNRAPVHPQGSAGCGEQEMPVMGIPTGDTAGTAWHSHHGWAGSSCQRQPARCQ